MHSTCQSHLPYDNQCHGITAGLAAAADVKRADIPMPACTLSDFDYSLPPGLIAQTPSPARTGSRLLHVQGTTLTDGAFADLPQLLAPDDLVVFNDTRVIKARLRATRPTGGKVELLLERAIAADEGVFQLRASHPPKPGGELMLPDGVRATVRERDGRFFRLRLAGVDSLFDYLERHGEVPLPPYIAHPAGAVDAARYQTVYARHAGAAAAPTAGLHFDAPMLVGARGRGHRVRFRHPSRRRRDVSAGRSGGPLGAPDARGVVPRFRRRRSPPSKQRARAAAGSSPSARPACARSSRRPTMRDACSPAQPKRGCSSRRVTASASSSGSSPISTCRSRPC